MKIFNTTGPVRAEDHYQIDPLSRWNKAEIDFLIEQKKYFVLHAPRQSGKTSAMLALQKQLNQSNQYYCLYVNVEPAQVARANVERGIRTILHLMRDRASISFKKPVLEQIIQEVLGQNSAESALSTLLKKWCAVLDKPLILLVDEIDSLVDDTLLSVLRQLREGYDTRPENFPQSVVLCGVRDVRDYRIHSTSQGSEVKGGSAFNIKSESLTLGNFTLDQIKSLYLQHTQATGQRFENEIWPALWQYTYGQPWLVNALAYELCYKMAETKITTTPISLHYLKIAKERLIQRRDTHLDQLVDKLKEERVKRIIQPLLIGSEDFSVKEEDDSQYSLDLGIVRKEKGSLVIANQIYQEIIPRVLVYEEQLSMTQDQLWYVDAKTKKLNTVKLLKAFVQFFRENIEHWAKDFKYPEAAPQLLLQAFLQRVINGGGRITREYGLGRGRLDLFVEWPLEEEAFMKKGKVQEIIFEFKVLHKRQSPKATEATALRQICEYADHLKSKAEKHVLICDPSPKKTWKQKIWQKQAVYKKQKIHVWGL